MSTSLILPHSRKLRPEISSLVPRITLVFLLCPSDLLDRPWRLTSVCWSFPATSTSSTESWSPLLIEAVLFWSEPLISEVLVLQPLLPAGVYIFQISRRYPGHSLSSSLDMGQSLCQSLYKALSQDQINVFLFAGAQLYFQKIYTPLPPCDISTIQEVNITGCYNNSSKRPVSTQQVIKKRALPSLPFSSSLPL